MKTQTQTSKAKTSSKAKQAPAKAKAQTKAASPAKGLFRFTLTPMGDMLRAYFIAYITAQIGELAPAKAFKLWPGINVSGHLAKANITKADGAYMLTPEGVSVFKASNAHALSMVPAFLDAVKTGKNPEGFKASMVEVKSS